MQQPADGVLPSCPPPCFSLSWPSAATGVGMLETTEYNGGSTSPSYTPCVFQKGVPIPSYLPQPITWSGYNYATDGRCWYNTFADAATVCQALNSTCCGIAQDHAGFEPKGGPSDTCILVPTNFGDGLPLYWLPTKTTLQSCSG